MLSITTASGHRLDLFADTSIMIEENSPMFHDIGSYSMPIELPPTPGNLQALEHPDRFQRRTRFVKSQQVVVACGAFVRLATMHIDSAVHRSSISATLYLRESNFYNAIKNKSLQELFDDKVRSDFQPAPGTNANQWVPYLERVMCGDVDDDFHIFPVLLSIDDRDDGDSTNPRSWKKFLIANRPAYFKSGSSFDSLNGVSQSGTTYYKLAATDFEFDKDNNITNISPPGYTVAPYLKLTYVLRYALQQIGYTLLQSQLDTDYSFQRLCVVHSTVDAIVTHNIKYSQLLPDIDLDAFLSVIENSFGLRFIVDEGNKTVTPRFFKDVLLEDSIADYSAQIEDYPQISYAGNRNIKLTALHQTEFSSPINAQSWQQLVAKYPPYRGVLKSVWDIYTFDPDGPDRRGLYLIAYERRYARIISTDSDPASWGWKWEYVDTYTHDYVPPGSDIPLEDKDLGFAITPLYPVPLVGYTPRQSLSSTSNIWTDFADAIGKMFGAPYPLAAGTYAYIPFVDSAQNLNTVLETVSVDSENNETVTYQDESEQQTPVLLAFAHGIQPVNSASDAVALPFASQDAYDRFGATKGSFDLLPISLYNNFWHRYDQLLQTSFHDISARINLTTPQLMALRFDKPATVHGALALPLSVQYELSHKGIQVANFTLRIIRPYE